MEVLDNSSILLETFLLVEEFFEGNHAKTTLWFSSPNPLLGGMTPYQMVQLGRGAKLLKFVKQQLAENAVMDR